MNEHIAPSRAKGLVRRGLVRLLQITGLNAIASKLYYDHVHGFRSASTGLDKGLEQIFRFAKDFGSFRSAPVYCEFGVFKGYSFWKAQQLANGLGISGLRFFGFDSFEGLPEVKGIDKEGGAEFRKGQYSCSLDAVKENLEEAGGVDWRNTYLVKGYFSQTLTPERASAYDIAAVGVAMIDCDLYESTVDVLNFLRGRLMTRQSSSWTTGIALGRTTIWGNAGHFASFWPLSPE